MKKYVALIILFCCGVSFSSAQERYIVNQFSIPSFYNADGSGKVLHGTFKYGDTIKVQNIDETIVKVFMKNSPDRYIEKKYLIPVKRNASEIPISEILSQTIWYSESISRFYAEPVEKSKQYITYNSPRLLFEVGEHDRNWLYITQADGSKRYLRKKDAHILSDHEKYAYFAPGQMPPELVVEEKPEFVVSDGFADGIRAGKKMIYGIVCLGIILLMLSIYRFKSGRFSGRMLGFYSTTLFLMSLIEIWYTFSVGIDNVYWFINFENLLHTFLYAALLLLFAVVQLITFLNTFNDLAYIKGGSRKRLLWPLAGIVLSYLILAIYKSVTDAEISNGFNLITVVCIIIGQIPVGFILVRNRRAFFPLGKIIFLIYYPVIASAIIGLIIGSIYIFAAVALGIGLLTAKPSPMDPKCEAEIDRARRQELEREKLRTEVSAGLISKRKQWDKEREIEDME